MPRQMSKREVKWEEKVEERVQDAQR